jgi:hypothetical protein
MTRVDLARLSDVASGVASGSSFPGTPTTGDLFFHTTYDMLFEYDGTRWLCTCQHTLEFRFDTAIPLTASGGCRAGHPGHGLGLEIWGQKFHCATFVITTNDGTKYWTYTLDTEGSVLSTISNAASAVVVESDDVNAVLSRAAYPWFTVTVTKVSTPGNCYTPPFLDYRFIGA